MFTGLIESLGKIVQKEARGGDIRLVVADTKEHIDWQQVALGDSIATSGCCLTVVEKLSNGFAADVSQESLAHTTIGSWRAGTLVNLEQSLTPSSRMGGHMVSGHVDGVGTVRSVVSDARSWRYRIEAPPHLLRYIAHKGSITVDGVSLTVNDLGASDFELSIVPHTLKETLIEHYKTGTKVNLEVDLIARYLERLLKGDGIDSSGVEDKQSGSSITQAFLKENGY